MSHSKSSSSTEPPIAGGLPRLTYRLADIAAVTGISRRSLERERAAGRFPKPDLIVGRMPLWRAATIEAWVGGNCQ